MRFLFAFALLVFTAVSCANVGPIIHDVEQCAAPAVAAIKPNLIDAVIAVLMCDGGNVSQLSPCAISGLEGLGVALGPDGLKFVDCVIASIEADHTQGAVVRVRARLWLAKRAAKGVKVVSPDVSDGGVDGGANYPTAGRVYYDHAVLHVTSATYRADFDHSAQ